MYDYMQHIMLALAVLPAVVSGHGICDRSAQCDTDNQATVSLLQSGLEMERTSTQPRVSVGNSAVMTKSICSIMMPLWSHANVLLDQEPLVDADCEMAELFYNWHSTDRYPNEVQYKNGTMLYLPIWKNAHQAIDCNARRGHKNFTADLEKTHASTYSFVREPLPRASSAYSELEFRIQENEKGAARFNPVKIPDDAMEAVPNERAKQMTYLRYPEGSSARASALVKDLVGLRFEADFLEVWHFFAQIGPLRNFSFEADRDIDFIGRLESLHEPGRGWDRVSDMAGEKLPWDNDCEEKHENTDASSGSASRATMDDLIAGHGPEELAFVCAMYLPDEVCLGYEVPTDECIAAGFAQDEDAWEETLQLVRETTCPDAVEMESLQD